MKSQLKVVGLIFAFLVSSQSLANADFEYDFAPSQWAYSETTDSAYGPSGTLTATQMQLTSANHTDWSGTQFGVTVPDQVGSYAITIPMNVEKIEFSYQYSTGDFSSSFYDMAQYTVDGVSTEIPPFTPKASGAVYGDVSTVSGTKSIDVKGKQGKTFSIDQLCNDCVLGSATVTITGFKVSRISYDGNVILSNSLPTISSDAKGYTCKPGSHTFLDSGISKSAAVPTSLVYTLIVNGARVSSVSSDNWGVLSRSSIGATDKSINGVATMSSATWLLDGANTKSAQCEVLAYQGNATALSYSNNS